MPILIEKVLSKCEQLGPAEAARYFGVTCQSIYNWRKGKSSPSIEAIEKVLEDEAKEKPHEVIQWEGRKVMILLPVYRNVSIETHFSLFANYAKYGPDKIGIMIEKRTLIHESRNILVDKFLKSDAEWCIFIDDDMILPFGNDALFAQRYRTNMPTKFTKISAFNRIMSHGENVPVVGALYYGRHDKGRAQCSDGFASVKGNADLHDFNQLGALREVRWTGTGMMRIHRSVFVKMKAMAEKEWPHILPRNEPDKPEKPVGYFTPDLVGQGEDVAFCLRCGKIGVPVYVDTGLICLHTGETHFGPTNTN
jgi:transcriptional regulator with XRE-family HTH domain